MKKILIYLLLFISITTSAGASNNKLLIGTIERPPFSYQENGQWTGFSIDLWKEIANDLNYNYSFQEFVDFGKMIESVQDNKVNLAIGNISITSHRGVFGDYSYPIFDSGIALMAKIPEQRNNNWKDIIQQIWFLRTIIIISVIILILIFSYNYLRENILTKEKYSLKLIENHNFRFYLLLFGILAITTISGINYYKITQNIEKQKNNLKNLDTRTLLKKTIGTTSGSSYINHLLKNNLDYLTFPSFPEVLSALRDGKVELVVLDYPLLLYGLQNDWKDEFMMVGDILHEDKLAIYLNKGSGLREDINNNILKLKKDGRYDEIYNKYFKR